MKGSGVGLGVKDFKGLAIHLKRFQRVFIGQAVALNEHLPGDIVF